MRVAVLGATGMLGHKVLQTLAAQQLDVYGTVRSKLTDGGDAVAFVSQLAPLHYEVDATDFACLEADLNRSRPDVVVNCIGIVKQQPLAGDSIATIALNSLLPHLLDRWCQRNEARLVHFSTDCVFSGRKGGYEEDDEPDPHDLYGRTKHLGEVTASSSLTIRTSIVGRELSSFRSLVEWLYAQQGGRVNGFARVLYSGVTTLEMARIVAELIRRAIPIRGLYQVAGPWISKYELLKLIRDHAGLEVEISRDDTVVSDRTMVGERFLEATGIVIPEWPQMVLEMVADPTPYKGAR